MITENLSTLQIHKLTREQYKRELEAGRIDEKALYLTPDEEIDLDLMELITNDDIDAICGGNVGVGGDSSVGSGVSAEPDLVINLLAGGIADDSFDGFLKAEYISCNWTDVENTISKCLNGQSVKVILKGFYKIHSGSEYYTCCEAFSVMAYPNDNTLDIYAWMPAYNPSSFGGCHIFLTPSTQSIRVESQRLNEM